MSYTYDDWKKEQEQKKTYTYDDWKKEKTEQEEIINNEIKKQVNNINSNFNKANSQNIQLPTAKNNSSNKINNNAASNYRNTALQEASKKILPTKKDNKEASKSDIKVSSEPTNDIRPGTAYRLTNGKIDDRTPLQKVFGLKSSEAFDDGWQPGDIIKTAGSTLGDISYNVIKGAQGLSEGIADKISYGIADIAESKGNKEFANRLRKNTVGNVWQETTEPFVNALDKNSISGNRLDSVFQGVGQSTIQGAVSLTPFGKFIMPTTTYLSSSGNAETEALLEGATPEEARIYSRIAGAGETITEYLSGGITSIGGKLGISRGVGDLDDKLAKALSRRVNSILAKNIIQMGVKASGEGVEEVLSGTISAIGKKLTYMKEEDIAKLIKDQNLLEQFIVGSMSASISQAPGGIISTINNQEYINLPTKQEIISKDEAQLRLQEAQDIINNAQNGQGQANNTTNLQTQQITQQENKTAQNGNTEQINNILDNQEQNKKQLVPFTIEETDDLITSAKKYRLNHSDESIQTLQVALDKRGIKGQFNEKYFKNEDGSVDTNTGALWNITTDENGNKTRSIILNPNASEDTIIQEVGIHELLHDIVAGKKEQSKQVYNRLLKYMEKDSNYKTQREQLENLYAQKYDRNSTDFQQMIDEEVVAKALQTKFGNQEEINRLIKYEPTTARSLYDKIVSKVNELFQKYNGDSKLLNKAKDYLFWKDIQNKFEYAYSQEGNYNNLKDDSKYFIETVEEFSKMKYNNATDISEQINYKERGILRHMIADDSNVKPGLNRIYTTNAEYLVYLEDKSHYKILSRKVDSDAGKLTERNPYTGGMQDGSSISRRSINDTTATKSNDGISDFGSTGESERVRNNRSSQRNNENVENSNKSSFFMDNKGRTLTKEQQEYFKDVSQKLRDENGNIKEYYHGTQRADRVGNYFDPNKATSGPMAFFTDNSNIAKSYSENKQDTSISREADTEYDLFKANGKDLDSYWNSLTKQQQEKINKKGRAIGFDENYENIVYDENHDSFSGQYDYYLKNEEHNNGIKALYDVFIQDGNLFGEDMAKFKDVLALAGINDVEYLDPYKIDSKVYNVYLKIKNPFDTSSISSEIFKELDKASKHAPTQIGYSADQWDKSNITPIQWMNRLKDDIENGTTHAWTSIPDWVTNVLKNNGYDGIVDNGGKNGGEEHQVVIPFYSNQIKNIDNLNPTDNPDIRYSNETNFDKYLENKIGKKGTRTNLQDIKLSTPSNENVKPTNYSMQNEQNNTQNNEKAVNNNETDNREYTKKKDKTLNPAEIANFTEEDANTTPKLKQKHYAEGNKESNFYRNVTVDSKFLNKDLRQEMSKDENIRYYKGITNEETLEKAYADLQKGGKSETLKWFNKESNDISAEDVAKGWILLKQYQDSGDYQGAIEVAKKMRNMATRIGQAEQAYNILSRLTPEGMFYYAQSELSEAYEKMAQGKSKEWIDENKSKFDLTPEETQFIKEKMESIQGIENERTKKVVLAEIQKVISDKIPPTLSQSVKAWMRISMLFNPKTQVRNVMGNAVILPVNVTSDAFAGALDRIIARKTGVRTTGITKEGIKGYAKGFGKGLYESYDDFRRGINTRNIEGNRFEVTEGKSFKDKGLGKALNRADNMLSFMLDAGDRGFYEATFTNSINNQLVLNNTTEVTQEMIDIAINEALQRTWQDNNAYTNAVLKIRNILNFGKGYGLGDVLIPFAKTPANLTKAIVDYSPVGLTKTLAIDARKFNNSLKNGQYTAQMQHQFVQNFGKGMAGSFLYVLGYALAKAGIATGEADDDKDVKNFMKNSLGISSYSIKIGDKTFTYDWAQPVATPLAIMTNYVKYSKDNPDANALEKIWKSMNIGTEQLLQQSFMESLNTVLNGNGSTLENLSQAVLELPARAIPTFSKQIADMIDGTQRTSFEYDKPFQSAINSVKVKIPVLSKTLPASVDTLGNEIKKYGGDNNLWNVMFNPANKNKGQLSKAGEEIYNVYMQTGDTTIFPRTAPYYINSNSEKLTLSSKERSDFQKITGKYVESTLTGLLNNEDYKKLSNEKKAEVINQIVSDSYAKAKYEILKIDSKEYEKLRNTLNSVSTVSYYDYKFKTKDMKKDKEKIEVLTNSNYSNNEKQTIYENYILSDTDKKYPIVKELFKEKENGLNIDKYLKYKLAESNEEFNADKKDDGSENGKSITGSGSVKRFNYINSIEGASYTQKLILYALDCKPSKNYQKDFVVNYIKANYKGNRQKEVLKIFGATIYKDGSFKY